MKLKFVELHTPLFLAGTNMGTKLDIDKRSGLEMDFDSKKDRIVVKWNRQASFFHWMNAANIQPVDPSDLGLEDLPKTPTRVLPQATHPTKLDIARTAQVSGPMDHVFQGLGAGKKKD